jgi:MerR family transcriptional regulator, light-induced transcriptional regulator
MQYLIKEMSILTGIKGSTIRKWQERYHIFSPTLADNGYWYYSDDDYLLLSVIKRLITEGQKISKIVALGKKKLLSMQGESKFSQEDLVFIKEISNNTFYLLKEKLDNAYETLDLKTFIDGYVRNLLVIVGEAWARKMLTVSDEHAFSRWIFGYLMEKTLKHTKEGPPEYLLAIFPGDQHELGALLHYILLLQANIHVKFVGILPLKYILTELKKGSYHTVGLSLTIPHKKERIAKVKKHILSKTKIQNIEFGGRGYQLSLQGEL